MLHGYNFSKLVFLSTLVLLYFKYLYFPHSSILGRGEKLSSSCPGHHHTSPRPGSDTSVQTKHALTMREVQTKTQSVKTILMLIEKAVLLIKIGYKVLLFQGIC